MSLTRHEIYEARTRVLVKAVENDIKSLSDDELVRVFSGTSSPSACIRSMHAMIRAGLSIDDVHNLFPPMADVDAYLARDESKPYCFIVIDLLSEQVVMNVWAMNSHHAVLGVKATRERWEDAELYAMPCAKQGVSGRCA